MLADQQRYGAQFGDVRMARKKSSKKKSEAADYELAVGFYPIEDGEGETDAPTISQQEFDAIYQEAIGSREMLRQVLQAMIERHQELNPVRNDERRLDDAMFAITGKKEPKRGKKVSLETQHVLRKVTRIFLKQWEPGFDPDKRRTVRNICMEALREIKIEASGWDRETLWNRAKEIANLFEQQKNRLLVAEIFADHRDHENLRTAFKALHALDLVF